MKRLLWIPILSIIALILMSVPVMAAPPVDNPGKGPVDKIVFVHYPKQHEAGKPPSQPGGGTGVLCPDYKYSGIHWGTPNVSYWINNNSSISHAVGALQASMDTWSNATDSLVFVYKGSTASNAGNSDGYNVISWADISKLYPNAIAVTSIWYYRYSREITEVDTQMNSDSGFAWSCTPPDVTQTLTGPATSDPARYSDPANLGIDNTYDIQNIMTHEAGHWLMLSDLYKSKDSALTMYGYGSTGELKKDTLGYGDELGIEQVYP